VNEPSFLRLFPRTRNNESEKRRSEFGNSELSSSRMRRRIYLSENSREVTTTSSSHAQRKCRNESRMRRRDLGICLPSLRWGPMTPQTVQRAQTSNSVGSLDGGSNVTKPSKDNGFGFHAYAVFYRNSAPYDDSFCNDKFPNQRTPLKDLLYNKVKAVNPLMRDCEKDENEIRWFHFPGNNMEWVEVGELPYMPIADEATKLSFRKQLHFITTKIALSMMASSAGPRTLLRAICYCDLSSGEANSMADVTMPSTPDT
jgi:hypothetical protein